MTTLYEKDDNLKSIAINIFGKELIKEAYVISWDGETDYGKELLKKAHKLYEGEEWTSKIDVDGEECHVDDEYVGVPLTVEIASCFLNIIKGIDFYPCELEFGKVIPTIVIYTKTWVFITAKFDGGNTFIKVTRNPFLG